MPFIAEDSWITSQASTHDVSELDDCSVAVDASYYLKYLLDHPPSHEPLLPALGGLTGIAAHIAQALDNWQAANITPFFIFDGQPLVGQIEAEIQHGLSEHVKLNAAWEMYSSQRAQDAVNAFGATSAFNVKYLYPLLMADLKSRNLHFIVAPYNASAQLAYFDMIESSQCAAIMGSQELLFYPIQDTFICSIDFSTKKVVSISKQTIVTRLNISEALLVDALLMMGTSFLPALPVIKDTSVSPRPTPIVQDAVNLLRTSSKSVAAVCSSYADLLANTDSNWLDKYQKARLAVNHFIYIAESGEIKVNDYDSLTGDNHEYLGLQLPAELFHYVNSGLISARSIDWIGHNTMAVLPNATGILQDDYKKLLSVDLLPLRQHIVSVIHPRLNRGIQHKEVDVRLWFNSKFSYKIKSDLNLNTDATTISKVNRFTIPDNVQSVHPPPANCSAVLGYEFMSAIREKFPIDTFVKEKEKPQPLADATSIRTLILLRFMYLRGYLDEAHALKSSWGMAIAVAHFKIMETVGDTAEGQGLYEAVFLAFELIRYGVLDGKMMYENLQGMPGSGSEEDKTSVLLICRCATLLNLDHQPNGYTGPLNKNLLGFSTLVSEVRDANRNLVEALAASLFLHAQADRNRTDFLAISQKLPFAHHPNVGMGIAMKTFLDDTNAEDSVEERQKHVQGVVDRWIPFAKNIHEDITLVYKLIDAICEGMSGLGDVISEEDRARWFTAQKYLQARPI
ncbi:hypothetical protein BROUX41_002127 [Berkeleyomyces rouxiae]|uniref:uncharacterized protein n=1 Tax=Berkeleyomyces rouxiae TaxID=2035830 RepID=UPI003B7BF3B8